MVSPKGKSSGGADVGTRNDSLAQAPRSIPLQRGPQNGREGFDGAYTLSPPQVGQTTTFSETSLFATVLWFQAQEHSASSKAQSSLLVCRRSSSSWRIMRMETISRLPLISGMNPRAGSKASRSNWKVRPCGRFC